MAAGQGDDYTTGFLLNYPYFRENYKLIAIDDNGFMIIYNLKYKHIKTQCYHIA